MILQSNITNMAAASESTTAESSLSDEVTKLIGQGRRHLVCSEVVQAVKCFEEATQKLDAKYGPGSDECGEAYLFFGKALLELARAENGVLGNALQDVEPKSGESSDEDEEQMGAVGPKISEMSPGSKNKIRDDVQDAMAEKEEADAKEKDNEKDETATEKNKTEKETKSEDKMSQEKVVGGKKEEKDGEKEEKNVKKETEGTTEGKEGKEEGKKDEEKVKKDEEKVKKDEEGKMETEGSKNKEEGKMEKGESIKGEECKKDKEAKSDTEEGKKDDEKVKKDEEGTKDQEECKNEESKTDKEEAKTDTEEGKKGEEEGKKGEEENEEEGEGEEEDMEGVEEENEGEGKVDGDQEGEEEEVDVPTMQSAWEFLELARLVFVRQENKEAQLNLAEVHLKLGEIQLEQEQFVTAVEEFQSCLDLQVKHLESDNRLIAETSYNMGLAYSFQPNYCKAHEFFSKALDVIKLKTSKLEARVAEWESKSKGKGKATDDDPCVVDRKELEELQNLYPEIKARVDDAQEMMNSASKQVESVTEEGFGTSGSDAKNVPATTIPTKPATLIPVRRKRKPEEDSSSSAVAQDTGAPVKKARQEESQPAAPVVTENGHDPNGSVTSNDQN